MKQLYVAMHYKVQHTSGSDLWQLLTQVFHQLFGRYDFHHRWQFNLSK